MASSQRNIETYPYTVVKDYGDIEIRKYEASLFTSVKMPSGSYQKSSGNGFRMLAGYIFGGNESNEKIAMTSPVSMSLEDSMTMMFMVPGKYKEKDLPAPNNKEIKIVEQPSKIMATITFGGWANDKKIDHYKRELEKALDEKRISFSNRFYYFGYNPPYEVFNRKNEVAVELNSDYGL
jgi:hypothetical protein